MAAISALAALVILAPGRPPASIAAQGATVSGLAEQGRVLYLQSCASCHGVDGGGTPYGPSLIGVGAASHDFYLRTGRMPLSAPGEPAYRQRPAFSEEQIRALVAFGATLGDGRPVPEVVTEGADLHRGWELYLNDCAACHGTSGSGGAIGGGFIAPDLHRIDAVRVVEAMLIGPGPMPVFSFSEPDLAAVAAYVEHLQEAPSPGGTPLGNAGPVPEGFIAGVIGLGSLVLIARWVARHHERPT